METWHILVATGVAAFVVEIFTAGFVAAAVGVGLLLAAVGNCAGLETHWQIVIFSFGLALTYFLVRPIITKYGYTQSKIKTNQEALLEKTGVVTEEINPLKNTGRVSIDGDDWRSKTANEQIIKVGTAVKVVETRSIVLIVKPFKN